MSYSDKVMNHFQHPRNVGTFDDANGVGEVGNAKCGNIMKMYLKIDEALKNSNKAVVEALDGLLANKIHRSVLAEQAVKAAVENYQEHKTA